MANSKSAAKRARQNIKKRMMNRARKTRIRNVCKNIEAALAENNTELASTEFLTAQKLLDRAVSWGVMHKNAVARKKSRLQLRIKKAATEASA
jgi:small subunit ribosomal protein S20